MFARYRATIAFLFSLTFHLISLLLIILSVFIFVRGLSGGEHDLITLIVKSINTLVISLAMYELGIGVGKEYTGADEGECIFQNMRLTITRFVGTVCIALVLESLIMIVKYSQLDLAGNLYYPVAILFSCSLLLTGLGLFLRLTGQITEKPLLS